mmetsp:Transcript_5237/g.7528  ORF Transcript_5237/g.7528 Transcript_5237/m.7528 type:complete len:398 (+) Transcript_5237:111-1304(+)
MFKILSRSPSSIRHATRRIMQAPHRQLSSSKQNLGFSRNQSTSALMVEDNEYSLPLVRSGTDQESNEIINSIKYNSALPSVVYLYDDFGSDLFELITKTEDYYPTRTEASILENNATEMARFDDETDGDTRNFNHSIIELGAGSGKKLPPLLDALAKIPKGATAKCTYIPTDYSSSALEENVNVYHKGRENVEPFCGTHNEAFAKLSVRSGRKTWAYFGNTLGNEDDPVPFLKTLAAHCGPQDRVFLGIDLATNDGKPVEVINRAYNDSEGVTSRFILNSLSVVNRIAGLDFKEDNFKLHSKYNHKNHAVEMFAECIEPCLVTADNGMEPVRNFKKGDRLFVEKSGKFTDSKIKSMLRDSGFVQNRNWTDERGFYSVLEVVPNVPKTATKSCYAWQQ